MNFMFSVASLLVLLAGLSACSDESASTRQPPTDSSAGVPAGPSPFDVLAALPPASQPVGLDVYAGKCASCHGNLGQGVAGNPALTRLTPAQMQQQLLAYRAGKTIGPRSAVMAQVTAGLNEADIAAVSIYAGI